MTGNHPRLQMHHTEARFVNGIKRALLIATRAVAMVFAILGVVLPLLPATPFLLIARDAASRFARRSSR